MKKKKLSKGINKYQQGGNPYDPAKFLTGINNQFSSLLNTNPIFNQPAPTQAIPYNEWKKQNGYSGILHDLGGNRTESEAKLAYRNYLQTLNTSNETNANNFNNIQLPIGQALFGLQQINETADLESKLGQKRDAYTLDDEIPQQAFRGYFQSGGQPTSQPRISIDDKYIKLFEAERKASEYYETQSEARQQKLRDRVKQMGFGDNEADAILDAVFSNSMVTNEDGTISGNILLDNKAIGEIKDSTGILITELGEEIQGIIDLASSYNNFMQDTKEARNYLQQDQYQEEQPKEQKTSKRQYRYFQQGGSNQQVMGYKDNSPYKNLPFQVFNTDTLTMEGVSKPLLAIPDKGQPRVMLPNSGIYEFPMANRITEIPITMQGGKVNLTGKINPFAQLPADYFKEGGSVKTSLITDSDAHNKKKGPGSSYPKNGPMGPKGYSYSTGKRDVEDYTVFNEYIPTENLIPIQTEMDELIVLPTGDITPVMATKKHTKMDESEVTDVTPEGSYILSAHGDVKIYKDEADSVITELGIKPYRLGYAQEKPTEKTLSSLMDSKKMSPADLGAKVMKQFPIWKTNNIFEASANMENKTNRKPYLEGIIQLSELDRYRKGLIQPEQMKNGGMVMRRSFLPSIQDGGLIAAGSGLLQGIMGLVGAEQQRKEAQRAYGDITRLVNQSSQTQGDLLGLGAGFGIASTLAQDPTVDYLQLDPSYVRQMEYRTPMGLRESMANRAYVNRPDYMRYAPSFGAGLSAEQAAYSSAVKQGYDAEMSLFERDRAARNQWLTTMQGYQDKNAEFRNAATNAMRLNRNQMIGNVGDRAQGLYDSEAAIEANRANAIAAAARLGQTAANQQAIAARTQGINSAIGSATYGYLNYLNSKPPVTIPSVENASFNLTTPTINSLYPRGTYNFWDTSTWPR